eukprot:m.45742 g.45742  ORF g.45742 m.45742 type:complete len:87 (-) comp10894_c1_seq1:703-963(-)
MCVVSNCHYVLPHFLFHNASYTSELVHVQSSAAHPPLPQAPSFLCCARKQSARQPTNPQIVHLMHVFAQRDKKAVVQTALYATATH